MTAAWRNPIVRLGVIIIGVLFALDGASIMHDTVGTSAKCDHHVYHYADGATPSDLIWA